MPMNLQTAKSKGISGAIKALSIIELPMDPRRWTGFNFIINPLVLLGSYLDDLSAIEYLCLQEPNSIHSIDVKQHLKI